MAKKKPDLPYKLRITGRQVVTYDQTVYLSREDYQRLVDAEQDEDRLTALLSDLIDKTDVNDALDIEPGDIDYEVVS